MKKIFIGFLLALTPSFSFSCPQASKGNNTSEEDFQIIRMEKDSLRPTREWTFNYTDKNFPCDHDEYDGTIKGFDTDGNGRFYILGGEPVRLACFIGQDMEWSRDLGISMENCEDALFKIIDDYIYFIDEANAIFRIHKDGKGTVERFPLQCLEKGEFCCGRLRENNFIIEIRPNNVPDSIPLYDDSHNFAYIFAYPNKVQKEIKKSDDIVNLFLNGTPKFPNLENNPPSFCFL